MRVALLEDHRTIASSGSADHVMAATADDTFSFVLNGDHERLDWNTGWRKVSGEALVADFSPGETVRVHNRLLL